MVLTEGGYVTVFVAAAVTSFVAATYLNRPEYPEVTAGLRGLLLTSGLWALFQAGRLIGPDRSWQIASFTLALSVGLAAVGAWLYLCSAYAGRSYHRSRRIRATAVGIYLTIVAVKLSNPIHGQYFDTYTATEPFVHLGVRLGVLHWTVLVGAYVLSAIGFALLYDAYRTRDRDTTLLTALLILTSLPVLINATAATTDAIVDLSYEPIGVALFALAVTLVAREELFVVSGATRQRIVDQIDQPILIVDRRGLLRDYNDSGATLFPAIEGSFGTRLADLVPSLADTEHADGPIRIETAAGPRHYVVGMAAAGDATGSDAVGVILNDVTEIEHQRMELQRQNDQLDDFAAAFNHELRNTVNVVSGYLDMADRAVGDDPATVGTAIDNAVEGTDRLAHLVDDLSLLARHARTVDALDTCTFGDTVETVRARRDDDLAVSVDVDGLIEAESGRLEELFATFFDFAVKSGATTCRIRRTRDGFTVTGDGEPIPTADADRAFEYGEAVPDAESGLMLPAIRTIATVHGWTVSIDEEFADGVRLVVGEATTYRHPDDLDMMNPEELSPDDRDDSGPDTDAPPDPGDGVGGPGPSDRSPQSTT